MTTVPPRTAARGRSLTRPRGILPRVQRPVSDRDLRGSGRRSWAGCSGRPMPRRRINQCIRQPEEDRCMGLTPECPKCECPCDDSGICLAILRIDCDKREVEVKGDCRIYVRTPRILAVARPTRGHPGKQVAGSGGKAAERRDSEAEEVRRQPLPSRGRRARAESSSASSIEAIEAAAGTAAASGFRTLTA